MLAPLLLGLVTATNSPARMPVPEVASAAEARGDWATAYRATRTALAACEARHGEADRCVDLLVAASNFAREGATAAEGRAMIERAVAVTTRLTGESFDTAAARNNLGLFLAQRGRAAEAAVAMAEALRIMRMLGNREAVAIVAYNYAEHLTGMGRYGEAEAPYREALAAQEKADEPSDRRLAARLEGLAINLLRLSRDEEAEGLMRRALMLTGDNAVVAAIRTSRLARLIANQGRFDEAILLQRTALEMMVAATGAGSVHSVTERNNLAVQLLKRERYDEAEPLLRQVLADRQAAAKNEPFDLATARLNLAELLDRTGRHRLAEPLLRQGLAGLIEVQGPDDEFTGHAHAMLGRNLWSQGRPAEAEAELRRAWQVRSASGMETRSDWIAAHADLARVLRGPDGRPAEARTLFRLAERGIRARMELARSDRSIRREMIGFRAVPLGHVTANWWLAQRGGSRPPG